jgi:hypothetical protein
MNIERLSSYKLLSTILISATLVASLVIASSQFSQQAIAQGGGNVTKTPTTQKSTSPSPLREPPLGKSFVWQGTVSSVQDPLKGHEKHQAAIILPPRKDGSIYTGVITYTASRPVEVVVLHLYDVKNTTKIPKDFSTELIAPAPFGKPGQEVAITLIKPDYSDSPAPSASIPFAGNALVLHTLSGKKFTATYTVEAIAQKPVEVSNIQSIMNATGTSNSTATSSSTK